MIDEKSAQLIAELVADRVFVRLSNSQISYSIESAAKACDVSPKTIRHAITDLGTLKASKPGNKWVITRDALETWLRRSRNNG